MHKVLFVCTANIFRSRFSEEVYNHLIKKRNLPSEAFSAGLRVGEYVTRKIYSPALQQLEYLKIKPQRKEEHSIHIDELILNDYDKIICMDEQEHRPMVNSNTRLKNLKIDYWSIVDEPKVSSAISLPKCYENVESLVNDVSESLKQVK